MQNLADDEVMLRYQQGEPKMLDELLRRWKNPIFSFALRLVTNAQEAQDVTQEVFLRLYQQKDAYEPRGKFSTWLFSIAHNLCISRIRERKWWSIWPTKGAEFDEPAEFVSPLPSPEEITQDNDLSRAMREGVQGLPFLQKEALILREYQNLDYREIARILKKPQGTVKTLIYRARQNLKIKLLPYLRETGGDHA